MFRLIWFVSFAVAAALWIAPVQAHSSCHAAWPPKRPQLLKTAPVLTASGRSGRIFCGDGAGKDCAVVEGGDLRVLTLMARRSGYPGCALADYQALCTVARISREWAITATHCFGCGSRGSRCKSPQMKNRFMLIQRDMLKQAVLPIMDPPIFLRGDLALLKLNADADSWFKQIPSPIMKLVFIEPNNEITEGEALIFGFGAAGPKGAADPARLTRTRMRFRSEDGAWRLSPPEDAPEVRLCGGDSGAPVLLRRGSGKHILIGIISTTNDRSCEAEAKPGATATNVIPFAKVIAQHIAK